MSTYRNGGRELRPWKRKESRVSSLDRGHSPGEAARIYRRAKYKRGLVHSHRECDTLTTFICAAHQSMCMRATISRPRVAPRTVAANESLLLLLPLHTSAFDELYCIGELSSYRFFSLSLSLSRVLSRAPASCCGSWYETDEIETRRRQKRVEERESEKVREGSNSWHLFRSLSQIL